MKIKRIILWIISLICPVIGIILYFIYKNNKDEKSNVIKGTVLGFCVYGVILLYMSTHSIDYFNRSVDDWYTDVNSGNTVLTVIGASYCEHCQAYKPIIKKIADKNRINLYFYEIDTLSESDQAKLTSSFYIGDYDGRVPYTFIMRAGKYISSDEGYASEQVTTNYLWENGLIKD